MDRGAWQVTVHRVARVKHDFVSKQQQHGSERERIITHQKIWVNPPKKAKHESRQLMCLWSPSPLSRLFHINNYTSSLFRVNKQNEKTKKQQQKPQPILWSLIPKAKWTTSSVFDLKIGPSWWIRAQRLPFDITGRTEETGPVRGHSRDHL